MSFRANCFKCHRNYNSVNPDEEGSVDMCPKCRKESKKIARMVDADIAKRPKKVPIPRMQPFQKSQDGRIEIYNARQFL